MKLKLILLLSLFVIVAVFFFLTKNKMRDVPRAIFKDADPSVTIGDVIGAPPRVANLNFDVLSDVKKAQKFLTEFRVPKAYKITQKWA